ncbi:MAG: hypothetical protein U1F77_01995 [Kiritimatiellia bacterium]
MRQEPRPTQIRQGKPATFFTPFPNQDKAFVQNLRILIPYYGFETVADAKAQPGIPINWEGELSTGGAINFFMDPSTVAGGMVDAFNVGAVSMFGPSPSMSGGDTATEYNWQLEKSTQIGLIYHNQNELFAVLDALVRAQDFLAELPFFQPGPDGKRNELPPVIAHWRRGRAVANGETGYGLMDGVWRLMVQGNAEDPDVGDLGLILRGYGASIRHHFGKPPEPAAAGAAPAAPNYAYYRRTNLARAWEEGFDVFFAAAVLGQGKVMNEHTGANQEKAQQDRSADLDAILAAAAALGPDLYDDKIRRLRGAGNSLAVAAGALGGGQTGFPAQVSPMVSGQEGGSLAEWMTWMSSGDASLLQPLGNSACARGSRLAAGLPVQHPRGSHAMWTSSGTPTMSGRRQAFREAADGVGQDAGGRPHLQGGQPRSGNPEPGAPARRSHRQRHPGGHRLRARPRGLDGRDRVWRQGLLPVAVAVLPVHAAVHEPVQGREHAGREKRRESDLARAQSQRHRDLAGREQRL